MVGTIGNKTTPSGESHRYIKRLLSGSRFFWFFENPHGWQPIETYANCSYPQIKAQVLEQEFPEVVLIRLLTLRRCSL